MITFLQRSLSDKNTYATTTERSRATHFTTDGGPIRPMAELDNVLVSNNRVVRLAETTNESLPEPLPMPTMNETEDDEQTVIGNVLPLPTMNFDKPGQKKDKKKVTASSEGLPEPLPLPCMSF